MCILVNLGSAFLPRQTLELYFSSFDAVVQTFHLLKESIIEGIDIGIILKSVLQIPALSVHDQSLNVALFLSYHILDVLVDSSVLIASSAQIRSCARMLNRRFGVLDVSEEKIGIIDSHAFLRLTRFSIS